MPAGNLDTTNLLLGILAAVSVLEAIALVAGGILVYRLYNQAMRTVQQLEERHVAPLVARVDTLMTKVDGILVDVKAITTRIGTRTERVDDAIQQTIDRVDQTAGRVRESMATRLGNLVAMASGARSVLGGLFNGRRSSGEAPEGVI